MGLGSEQSLGPLEHFHKTGPATGSLWYLRAICGLGYHNQVWYLHLHNWLRVSWPTSLMRTTLAARALRHGAILPPRCLIAWTGCCWPTVCIRTPSATWCFSQMRRLNSQLMSGTRSAGVQASDILASLKASCFFPHSRGFSASPSKLQRVA